MEFERRGLQIFFSFFFSVVVFSDERIRGGRRGFRLDEEIRVRAEIRFGVFAFDGEFASSGFDRDMMEMVGLVRGGHG